MVDNPQIYFFFTCKEKSTLSVIRRILKRIITYLHLSHFVCSHLSHFVCSLTSPTKPSYALYSRKNPIFWSFGYFVYFYLQNHSISELRLLKNIHNLNQLNFPTGTTKKYIVQVRTIGGRHPISCHGHVTPLKHSY